MKITLPEEFNNQTFEVLDKVPLRVLSIIQNAVLPDGNLDLFPVMQAILLYMVKKPKITAEDIENGDGILYSVLATEIMEHFAQQMDEQRIIELKKKVLKQSV